MFIHHDLTKHFNMDDIVNEVAKAGTSTAHGIYKLIE